MLANEEFSFRTSISKRTLQLANNFFENRSHSLCETFLWRASLNGSQIMISQCETHIVIRVVSNNWFRAASFCSTLAPGHKVCNAFKCTENCSGRLATWQTEGKKVFLAPHFSRFYQFNSCTQLGRVLLPKSLYNFFSNALRIGAFWPCVYSTVLIMRTQSFSSQMIGERRMHPRSLNLAFTSSVRFSICGSF